jgi:hypothetical protein
VLDLFCGSGGTVTALMEGRKATIDRSPAARAKVQRDRLAVRDSATSTL